MAIIVILTLNPAQLLFQARDSSRLSDMQTLTKAVQLYDWDQGGSLGTANTTYVSVPDPAATTSAGSNCSSLGLPALPTGDSYHCAGSNYYRNTDGTGWIPLDFQKISSGSPVGELPKDPVNTSSTGDYYTYTPGGSFELMTAPCEAIKDQKGDACDKDGGVSSLMYEAGSDLTLAPAAVIGRASTYAELTSDESALVGYWKFDDGSGTTAADSSGNGNTGTLEGSTDLPTWQSNCQVGGCLSFDGSDDYVSVPSFTSIDTGSFTIMHWFKLSGTNDSGSVGKGTPWNSDAPGYGIRFLIGGGFVETDINIGSGTGAQSNQSYTWNTSTWHHIAWVVDRTGGTTQIYIDGQFTYSVGGIPTTGSTASASSLNFGNGGNPTWFLTGALDDVRIYNRALSATEISAIYNAEK